MGTKALRTVPSEVAASSLVQKLPGLSRGSRRSPALMGQESPGEHVGSILGTIPLSSRPTAAWWRL